MITPEAEQLYREAVEYTKRSGLSYAQALKAVLKKNPLQPGKNRSSVLQASTTLDAEIHRLLFEERFTDYTEGLHHVLNSRDPRHVAIARAYVAA
jgi:hypothetical protein